MVLCLWRLRLLSDRLPLRKMTKRWSKVNGIIAGLATLSEQAAAHSGRCTVLENARAVVLTGFALGWLDAPRHSTSSYKIGEGEGYRKQYRYWTTVDHSWHCRNNVCDPAHRSLLEESMESYNPKTSTEDGFEISNDLPSITAFCRRLLGDDASVALYSTNPGPGHCRTVHLMRRCG